MVQQNNLKETFNSELLSEYISQEKPLDRVKRLYKKKWVSRNRIHIYLKLT